VIWRSVATKYASSSFNSLAMVNTTFVIKPLAGMNIFYCDESVQSAEIVPK
jgi:hypothetical protein